MENTGEIIVIDDDKDDLFMYESVFTDLELPYPVSYFEFPKQIFEYLENLEQQPFLIICDINMPLVNGFKLRELMLANKNLNGRLTPFVFITNTRNEIDIFKAHELFAFGLYNKQIDYNEHKRLIEGIITTCTHIHKLHSGL